MNKPSHIKNALASASAAVGYGAALILLDLVVAGSYGTGSSAAVFQAAYALPALLIGVFSGGAVIGASVPIFVRLAERKGAEAAARFIGTAALIVAATLIAIAAACALAADGVVVLVAAGMGPAEREQAAYLLRVILPMLIMHGVGSTFVSALMAVGSIALPNLTPALIPLGAVAGHYFFGDALGAASLAYGLLGGGVLQVLLLSAMLRGRKTRLLLARDAAARGEFWRAYTGTVLAAAGLSALYFANQAIAGSLSGRDLAAFSYGTKLVTLFLAFCTTVVANSALRHFSAVALQGRPDVVWDTVRQWAVKTSWVLVPVAILWALFAPVLVELVYRRGAFHGGDVELVADVQRWFVLQTPAYVIGVVGWRMQGALGKASFPAVSSLAVLALDVALASYLGAELGIRGVAMAHSAAVFVWMLAMLYPLRPRGAALGYSSPPRP